MLENLYPNPKLPSAPLMSQESFKIETIREYHQDILDLKNKYHKKQRKYKNAYNNIVHASTGPSSVGVISGISTIGTTFTVGIPISASLGDVSTVSTCVVGILLLTSKKYKKKVLKCCQLINNEFISYLQGFNQPKFK